MNLQAESGARVAIGAPSAPVQSASRAGETTLALQGRALWQLLRPAHWVKNVFVLAPLAFAKHQSVLASIPRAFVAFAAFCVLSSAVYALNDALDAEADRAHPRKRYRPVAARVISARAALVAAGALTIAGLLVAGSVSTQVLAAAALYVANNLLYTLVLKHKVIADVVSIAIGFVLRLLGGAAAIDVPPSSWLIVCGFAIALLLGFGKRRAELITTQGHSTRATLANYTPEKLDSLMSICGSVSLVSYMLYTVAAETVRVHDTDKLIYTIPFVAYGIFRFIFKVQEGKAEDPVSILLEDHGLQATIVLWLVASLLITQSAGLLAPLRP